MFREDRIALLRWRREVMKRYLQMKLDAEDYSDVVNGAITIKNIDAEIRGLMEDIKMHA